MIRSNLTNLLSDQISQWTMLIQILQAIRVFHLISSMEFETSKSLISNIHYKIIFFLCDVIKIFVYNMLIV